MKHRDKLFLIIVMVLAMEATPAAESKETAKKPPPPPEAPLATRQTEPPERNAYFQGHLLEEEDLAETPTDEEGEVSPLARNKYFEGKTLEEKDLKAEQNKAE